MLKFGLKTLGLATIVTGVMAGTIYTAQAEKWDMPMAYADSNFHTQNGKAFAAAVTKATGGKLEIVVHGGGSLFKGGQIKRAVQTGQVPIGERLLSAHQNENALFGADSVPFLATSFGDSSKLWKAARPTIEKILLKQNLVLLYAVPWPPQGLYFKKPVNSIADAKGVKFRSYNSSTARIAQLMGMLPVQIEAAELTQALATGVAEAFVSSGSTGVDRKVWEQLTHFYDVQAWLPRNYIFVNKASWDKLDGATQKIVKEQAAIAEAKGTAKSAKLAGEYLKTLAKNGMKVQPAGAKLLGQLKTIGGTMTTEWLKKAGPEGQAIVKSFKAMK